MTPVLLAPHPHPLPTGGRRGATPRPDQATPADNAPFGEGTCAQEGGPATLLHLGKHHSALRPEGQGLAPKLALFPNAPARSADPRSCAFFTRKAETKALRASAPFETRPNPRAGRHA